MKICSSATTAATRTYVDQVAAIVWWRCMSSVQRGEVCCCCLCTSQCECKFLIITHTSKTKRRIHGLPLNMGCGLRYVLVIAWRIVLFIRSVALSFEACGWTISRSCMYDFVLQILSGMSLILSFISFLVKIY